MLSQCVNPRHCQIAGFQGIDTVLGIAGCVCRNAVKLKNEIRHGQSNCIDTGFLAQMHLKCRRHFVKSTLVRHIDFSACIFLGRRSYVYNLSLKEGLNLCQCRAGCKGAGCNPVMSAGMCRCVVARAISGKRIILCQKTDRRSVPVSQLTPECRRNSHIRELNLKAQLRDFPGQIFGGKKFLVSQFGVHKYTIAYLFRPGCNLILRLPELLF